MRPLKWPGASFFHRTRLNTRDDAERRSIDSFLPVPFVRVCLCCCCSYIRILSCVCVCESNDTIKQTHPEKAPLLRLLHHSPPPSALPIKGGYFLSLVHSTPLLLLLLLQNWSLNWFDRFYSSKSLATCPYTLIHWCVLQSRAAAAAISASVDSSLFSSSLVLVLAQSIGAQLVHWELTRFLAVAWWKPFTHLDMPNAIIESSKGLDAGIKRWLRRRRRRRFIARRNWIICTRVGPGEGNSRCCFLLRRPAHWDVPRVLLLLLLIASILESDSFVVDVVVVFIFFHQFHNLHCEAKVVLGLDETRAAAENKCQMRKWFVRFK